MFKSSEIDNPSHLRFASLIQLRESLQSVDFLGAQWDRHTFRRRMFSVCRGHIVFNV
jgi:hypothetical protein